MQPAITSRSLLRRRNLRVCNGKRLNFFELAALSITILFFPSAGIGYPLVIKGTSFSADIASGVRKKTVLNNNIRVRHAIDCNGTAYCVFRKNYCYSKRTGSCFFSDISILQQTGRIRDTRYGGTGSLHFNAKSPDALWARHRIGLSKDSKRIRLYGKTFFKIRREMRLLVSLWTAWLYVCQRHRLECY